MKVGDGATKVGSLKFIEVDKSLSATDIEIALGYAPVKDVQVAGASVMADGVANVPNAVCIRDDGSLGAVDPPQHTIWSGLIGISKNTGALILAESTKDTINKRDEQFIGGKTLDYAVKAAMCDGKGAAWTAEEQKAARDRIGVDKEYELIEEITLTENVTQIIRTDEPDGTAYAFERVAIKINRTNTGEGGVYVYSGSTVLGWSYLAESGQYFACETFSLHGYWQNYRYSASSGHNDYNNIASSGDSRFLKIKKVAGQYVSKIKITLNNAELGIGTKISIYGVRA